MSVLGDGNIGRHRVIPINTNFINSAKTYSISVLIGSNIHNLSTREFCFTTNGSYSEKIIYWNIDVSGYLQ